jgi:hypothetical protein
MKAFGETPDQLMPEEHTEQLRRSFSPVVKTFFTSQSVKGTGDAVKFTPREKYHK